MVQIFYMFRTKVTRYWKLLNNYTEKKCGWDLNPTNIDFYSACDLVMFYMGPWYWWNQMLCCMDDISQRTSVRSLWCICCCGTGCFTRILRGYLTANVIITSLQCISPGCIWVNIPHQYVGYDNMTTDRACACILLITNRSYLPIQTGLLWDLFALQEKYGTVWRNSTYDIRYVLTTRYGFVFFWEIQNLHKTKNHINVIWYLMSFSSRVIHCHRRRHHHHLKNRAMSLKF